MSIQSIEQQLLKSLIYTSLDRPGENKTDRVMPNLYEELRSGRKSPYFGTLHLMARLLSLDYDAETSTRAHESCQTTQEARKWISDRMNKLLWEGDK